MKTIVSHLKRCGDDVRDVCMVEKILGSLTTKFDYVACIIKKSKDLATMSVGELWVIASPRRKDRKRK